MFLLISSIAIAVLVLIYAGVRVVSLIKVRDNQIKHLRSIVKRKNDVIARQQRHCMVLDKEVRDLRKALKIVK